MEGRVEALLRSPVGSAFVLAAAHGDAGVDEISAVPTVFALAGNAVGMVTPWIPEYDAVAEEATRRALAYRDLAEELLTHPASAWWFEPLDRTAQVWLGTQDEPDFSTPTEASDHWERYAQKPRGPRLTSTMRDGTSSLQVGIESRTGDLQYQMPVRRIAFDIDPQARIYEVDGPESWHALCCAHPAIDESRNHPFGPGMLVPEWLSVARAYDGVHLSFGALLTASQVRVESDAGWSQLWALEAEWTIWLRDVSIARRDLEPLETFEDHDAAWVHLGPPSGKRLRRVKHPGLRRLVRRRTR